MVLYCVQHNGFILKALIHKCKYHYGEEAVFFVEAPVDSEYCPKIKGIQYHKIPSVLKMVSYSSNYDELISNTIETIDKFFNECNLSIEEFNSIYALYDMYNPFTLYFEVKKIKYMCIESLNHQFNYYWIGKHVNDRLTAFPAYNTYDRLIRDMHLQDAQGDNCIKGYLFSSDSHAPEGGKVPTVVFSYYQSLSELSDNIKDEIIQAYKINLYNCDNLIILNSQGWTDFYLKHEQIQLPELYKLDCYNNVYLFYKTILDYYFNNIEYALKLHPVSNQNFVNAFSDNKQIPCGIPVELFAWSKKNIRIICPVQSSGLDYFKELGHSVDYFGINIFKFIKTIHFSYVSLFFINQLKLHFEKIFINEIDKKQFMYFKSWAFSNLKDVEIEELTQENISDAKFIIANTIDNKLLEKISSSTVVIVNCDYSLEDEKHFFNEKLYCTVTDLINENYVEKNVWTVISKNSNLICKLSDFSLVRILKHSHILVSAFPVRGTFFNTKAFRTESEIKNKDFIFFEDIQNKINILQCYYEAEKKGIDLRKFLEMFDWLKPNYKIAFYAIGEFGAMVYRICQRCGLNFSAFLSDQDRELTCIAPDNSQVRLNCKNIYSADKSLYDGIFAAITYDAKQLDILKGRGGLFLFDAVANYIYTKVFFVDRISEIIQKNPLVKAGIFITPTIYQLGDEKSEPEKYFMNHTQKYGGVCSIEDKTACEKLKTVLYRDYGFDDEYISEVCRASYPINPQNNTMFIGDHSGKYSNVINHRRVTTDTPKEYKNTVYFFGDSCVTGLYVGDSETIESYFQRKLNQNGIPYLVQNCANTFGKRYDWIFTLTESMQFKPGDILIFCSKVDWLTQQHLKDNNQKFLNGILGIYTFPLFQRPHNHGEVFSDAFHFNSKGNELIAEKIFDDLQAADYFNDNFEPTEQTVSAVSVKQEKAPITAQYSEELNKYLGSIKKYRPKIGSIVMNCNPFTLGHRYLIEYAASQVERLYIFVVEEDKSIFPFADRFELVKKGTADLENVTVLSSGKFIISSLTFQQYFEKGELQDTVIDSSEDVEIFAKEIAPTMGITVRFVGEEPLDNVTRQYNESMRNILPQYGIEFVEIPRKKQDETVISASRVRKLLNEKSFDEISMIVPDTTLEYLKDKFDN